jgi:choline dehydrogenase-like flavoprotein
VDVTYLQDAANRGASIIADARADTVEVNGNKKIVRGNILERGSGVSRGSFAVDSSVVIVSASATSTPLILGRSGLGGTSGELGRNLTFHKTSAVIGVYDTPQLSWKGIPQSAMCDEFMNDDGRRGGFWVESAPFGPVLASMSLASFGKTHAEGMELLPYISVFLVLVNDTDSGGSVSPTDSGRPSLRYSTGPNDAAYMLRAIATAARMHFAAGARQVMTLHSQPVIMTDPGNIDRSLRRSAWGENDVAMFSAHPLGTCRMGTDPRSSVVDRHGMIHDRKGIFVIDGSMLPTSLSVNPQVTILAVAESHAEWISDNWQSITS